LSQNAHLSGVIGQPVELREVGANNTPLVNISLGCERYDFSKKEKVTDWLPVTIFGSTAEYLAKNAIVGDKLYVQAEVRIDTYQSNKYSDKDGNQATIYKTEFVANNVDHFYTGNEEKHGPRGTVVVDQRQDKAPKESAPKSPDAWDFGGDDDIPF